MLEALEVMKQKGIRPKNARLFLTMFLPYLLRLPDALFQRI